MLATNVEIWSNEEWNDILFFNSISDARLRVENNNHNFDRKLIFWETEFFIKPILAYKRSKEAAKN